MLEKSFQKRTDTQQNKSGNIYSADINELAKRLQERITDALDVVCPKKRCYEKLCNPWYSEDLADLKEELSLIKQSDRELWRVKRNLYVKKVRDAKKAYWQSRLDDMGDPKAISSFLNNSHKDKGAKMSLIRHPSGALCSTYEDH